MSTGSHISFGTSEREKIAVATADGLVLRALNGDVEQVTGGRRELSEYAFTVARMKLIDLATRCLELNGQIVDNLSDVEIAQRALSGHSLGFATRSSGGHFHQPATLPGLLLEVGNRILLAGFQGANQRWREWIQVGDPVNDFRPVSMHGVDEGGLLDMIPDDQAAQEDKASTFKETTAAELYGKSITLSYRALINDDLGSFNSRLTQRGRMADKTINRAALAILTGNPVLTNDNVALFDASHSNIVAAGGPPDVTQLGLMRKLLRQQTGLNSSTKLNLELKTLIVPAALEAAAEAAVYSRTDPSASNNAKYNPFGGKVGLIVEPDLDDASAVKYYGLANHLDHATVLIRFMQGQESPLLNDVYDPATMGRKYTVLQSWAGPVALDFRGMVRNEGTGG